MIHVWTVVCRRTLLDKDSNTLSLIESVEALQITPLTTPEDEKPVGLPIELEIATLWTRSEPGGGEHGRNRVNFVAPDKSSVVVGEPAEVDLRKFQRVRARVRLAGLRLKGEGRYWFSVELASGDEEWEEVARIPLDVNFRQEA